MTLKVDATPSDGRGETETSSILDAVYACISFLGRAPEPNDLEQFGGKKTPIEIISSVISSQEFNRTIVCPVLDGFETWLDKAQVDQVAASWLAHTFNVPSILSVINGIEPTWRKVYANLFTESNFVRTVEPKLSPKSFLIGRFAKALLLPVGVQLAGTPEPPPFSEANAQDVLNWGGFDVEWYSEQCGIPFSSQEAAVLDYLSVGESVGRRPNPLFDPIWYRRNVNLDKDTSPLLHYLSWNDQFPLWPCQIFDAPHYRASYQKLIGTQEPLIHYLRGGWREGCEPNQSFDVGWYVDTYGLSGETDPLFHYMASADNVRPHAGFDVNYIRERAAAAGRWIVDVSCLELYLEQAGCPSNTPTPLFDPLFYYLNNNVKGDLLVDPFWHYYKTGWLLGYDPCPLFSTKYYLEVNEDVQRQFINPLAHYLNYGANELRNPSPLFSTHDYLDRNHDVREAKINPLTHYLLHGAAEGRKANWLFDESWYIQHAAGSCLTQAKAVSHYLSLGWRSGFDPNPLFDVQFYLDKNTDVAAAAVEPLSHFMTHGWLEGRDPNPFFDTSWYLSRFPNSVADGIDPLTHFARFGADSNLDPGPDFSTAWYRAQHPEVDRGGWNPLAYYLHVGRKLNHAPRPNWKDLKSGSISAIAPAERIDPYTSWLEVNEETAKADRMLLDALSVQSLEQLPKISVVMPCYQSDRRLLVQAIESVRTQLYENWELCICDDFSSNLEISSLLSRYSKVEARIKWVRSPKNLNISGASNLAAGLATGDVIALLDHDDTLTRHALAEVAICYAKHPKADIVYSDDDKLNMSNQRYAPQFKPGWSPVLLLSFMYISHLFSFRRSLFEQVGGFRSEFDGAQDFDLALRLAENARQVERIPRVLYHWRAVENSTAASADTKPEAFERGRRAVQEALDRRGINAHAVLPDYAVAARVGMFDLVFPDEGPSVTVLVPTRNKLDLLRPCIESLRRTTYANYRVLILDNDSDDAETLTYIHSCGAEVLRVTSPPEGFSFSHLINAGVRAVDSEYVLFLNNDTEVRTPHWLSQMIGYAQMPGVGAVGARLLYADGLIQHAGITHGLHEGMAGHACKLLPSYDHGYLGLARASREVAGVTAACLLTPRQLFLDFDGLDQAEFRVSYNDVDYCYRLVDAGYRCIQCNSAELFHYEGRTRGFGDNPAEERAMRRKYHGRIDRWYNPNLALDHEQFGIARTHVARPRHEPLRVVFASHNYNHEGAPNSLFELSTGLKTARRLHPIVISPQEGPLLERYQREGVDASVIAHPLAGWPTGEELEASLRRLGQAFLYAGADVVVANTAEAFWAVEAAHRAGLPAIWIIRESEPWQTYYAQLPPQLAALGYAAFQHCYRVVFVSRSTMEAWQPLNDRNAFTLIRNGLDTAKLIQSFQGLDRGEARTMMAVPDAETCVFTCLGTVAERKGQIDLVRAFACLPLKAALQAAVYIVGDRPSAYSEQLHREVGALDPERRKRVRIVPETDLARSYLVGSDVFICTSRVESYPRVTLEAMAAGLPLLTTPVWGIREQVRPDYNASLYEPGDVTRLADLMMEMIELPERRQLFASRSVPVFESLPDFPYMRDRYGDIIEQAVGSL